MCSPTYLKTRILSTPEECSCLKKTMSILCVSSSLFSHNYHTHTTSNTRCVGFFPSPTIRQHQQASHNLTQFCHALPSGGVRPHRSAPPLQILVKRLPGYPQFLSHLATNWRFPRRSPPEQLMEFMEILSYLYWLII